jgi:hypothetical protein
MIESLDFSARSLNFRMWIFGHIFPFISGSGKNVYEQY